MVHSEWSCHIDNQFTCVCVCVCVYIKAYILSILLTWHLNCIVFKDEERKEGTDCHLQWFLMTQHITTYYSDFFSHLDWLERYIIQIFINEVKFFYSTRSNYFNINWRFFNRTVLHFSLYGHFYGYNPI